MTSADICRALDISPRTWRRWRAGNIPAAGRLALAQLRGEIHGWPGFRVNGPWLETPDGSAVHQEVCGNLEYFAYLQRSLGFVSDWPPSRPKNPVERRLLDPWTISQLERLRVLGHNENGLEAF